MKITVIYLVLLFFASNIIAQESDLQKENLKGNIVSVQTREFEMVSKFGEYIKKNQTPLCESWKCFNKFGNRVILKKGKENDSLGISKTSIFVPPTKDYSSLHYIYNANQKLLAIYSLKQYQEENDTTLLIKIRTDTIQKDTYSYNTQGKLLEFNSYEKKHGIWYLTKKEKYSYTPTGRASKTCRSFLLCTFERFPAFHHQVSC